jgi:hypothetical protein
MQVELACDIGRRPNKRCYRTHGTRMDGPRTTMVTWIKPDAFNRTVWPGLEWVRNT